MWSAPNRMWKSRRKFRLLLFILVTQLRGMVAAVHRAILLLVWALRQLDGQVHSFERAKILGILPGSRSVAKDGLDAVHRILILGLVLLEGAFPPTQLNPGMKHFVHYPAFTKTHGILRILWMMAFERCVRWRGGGGGMKLTITFTHHRLNKYNKSLIKNPHTCEVNLVKAASRDMAAHFNNLKRDTESVIPRLPHQCVLCGRETLCHPTDKELADLRLQGVDVQALSVSEFKIAYILNVHFKAGEWGQSPWCGSVVTCVIGGRSLYAHVLRFLTVEGDDCPGYASVCWFGAPVYLFDYETPLGVCVSEDGGEVEREVGTCVLRITQIDPSPVIVEREVCNGRFFMMRDSGYDTRPSIPIP